MVKKEGVFVNNLTVLYALRYALKRIGPAHQIVRDDIFNNLDQFSADELEKFRDEIIQETSSEGFRDDKNKTYWVRFIRELDFEIKLKKEIMEMYKE